MLISEIFSLNEALNTSAIHDEALKAVHAIIAPLSRNEIVFEYDDKVREPIRDALSEIARHHQNPNHPLQIYVDFVKSGFSGLGQFFNDGDQGIIIVEVYAILDLGNEKWDRFDYEADTSDAIRMIAHVFAHEFLHYRQKLKAWNVENRTKYPGRIRKTTKPDDYRSHSREIHAHAQDTARELHAAFGHKAIDMLRSTDGIKAAIKASPGLKGYYILRAKEGGITLFRMFLRHLVLHLQDRSEE